MNILKSGFLGFLNLMLGHVLFRVKYVNLEKIQNVDKCVICPNHSHSFDPFWIKFKVDNLWIMAKAELFKNKIMAALLKAYNVFPIKRGQKDASSLLHSINAIENNEHAKLLIFIEGTRIKKDKQRGKAKFGSTYIASKAGVPIVPVHITKNPKLFSKVTVIFGDPIVLPENLSENKTELQKYSDIILDKIYDLEK